MAAALLCALEQHGATTSDYHGDIAFAEAYEKLSRSIHLIFNMRDRELHAAMEKYRASNAYSFDQVTPLTVLVDPGSASPEQIGLLLAELSKLYRMVGGAGIVFTLTDVRATSEVLT